MIQDHAVFLSGQGVCQSVEGIRGTVNTMCGSEQYNAHSTNLQIQLQMAAWSCTAVGTTGFTKGKAMVAYGGTLELATGG